MILGFAAFVMMIAMIALIISAIAQLPLFMGTAIFVFCIAAFIMALCTTNK
jgi:hypothetical protein